MTNMAWVVPMLTATVKLSRLARQDSPALGILDGWARLYPHKRLALKTIELIVHDRLGKS